MDRVWASLRGIIRDEFTFALIKELAGASGLPVQRLSHLQQKSLPARSASKLELLDGVDGLLNDEPDPSQAVQYFVEEMLKRKPHLESAIGASIKRFGWSLHDGRLRRDVPQADPTPPERQRLNEVDVLPKNEGGHPQALPEEPTPHKAVRSPVSPVPPTAGGQTKATLAPTEYPPETRADPLPPKPPEFLQKLKWLYVHGRHHWKWVAAAGILMAGSWAARTYIVGLTSGKTNDVIPATGAPAHDADNGTQLPSSPRIVVRYSRWEFVSSVSFEATTPNHAFDKSDGTPRSSDGEWRASDTRLEISAPKGHRLNNVRIIHVTGPHSHHERQRIGDSVWRAVATTNETVDIRFSEGGRRASIVIRAYTYPIAWSLRGEIERLSSMPIEKDVSRDGALLRFDVPRDAVDPTLIFDLGGPSEAIASVGEDFPDVLRYETRTEDGAVWRYLYSVVED